MRTSALLVLVFTAISTPSFAAPVVIPPSGSSPFGHVSVCQRLPAICEPAVARDVDDSAAIGRSWLPRVANFLPGSNNNQQRDYANFEARVSYDDEDSGAAISSNIKGPMTKVWKDGNGNVHYLSNFFTDPPRENLLQQRRELLGLVTRAVTGDISESDAINLKPILKGGLSLIPTALGLLHGSSGNGTNSRREFDDVYELLARDDDDESGAGILNVVKNVGSLIYHGISSLASSNSNQQQRREYNAIFELLARAAGEEYHAFTNNVPIIPHIPYLFGGNQQQRRTFDGIVELLSRTNYELE